MLYVHALSVPRPPAGVLGLQLPGERRGRAVRSGTACLRNCRLDGCPGIFAAGGDAATGNEVAERLRAKVNQPVSLLARWIVDRQVVAFSCGSNLLLPLFQFDFGQGCVRSGVAPAISELAGVMTDDEVARWFVQPNGWLKDRVPAQTLLTDVPAVLAAARADRFVARG